MSAEGVIEVATDLSSAKITLTCLDDKCDAGVGVVDGE